MELSEIFRFVASLLFILGLIGLCAYAAKRLGLATGGAIPTGTQKRLSVVEVKVIDGKHRLVLMRRDDREHLVLIGGERDLLIESGIEAPAKIQEDSTQTPPAPTGAALHVQKIVDFIKERRRMRQSLNFMLRQTPLLAGIMAAMLAFAITGPALADTIKVDLADNFGLTDHIVQIVALITVLSLAPSIFIMVTSFVRIVVVLSLLRTAIGTQQTPPNSVLISLALFLTAFVMTPTFTKAYHDGIEPLMNHQMEIGEAFEKSIDPFKTFMLTQFRKEDLKLFVDLSNTPEPEEAKELPIQVIVPSFMLSELRRAFEIGFLIFLPFIVIDMVVASVLMSMGMMMLPPVTISLPFKLIFFVLVDGWSLIAGSLVQSFGH